MLLILFESKCSPSKPTDCRTRPKNAADHVRIQTQPRQSRQTVERAGRNAVMCSIKLSNVADRLSNAPEEMLLIMFEFK